MPSFPQLSHVLAAVAVLLFRLRETSMPSEVVSTGMRMAAFPGSNRGMGPAHWQPVSVPVQWPFMLAEIFIGVDDVIWMTSAVGVPKSCEKAFFAQGI